MKLAILIVSTTLLALSVGCGQVVVERDGRAGSGGSAGTGGGGGAGGGAVGCATANCSSDADSCSCETACTGPKLRADCKLKSDSTIICECHYDGGYLGTCGHTGGPLCGLPGGCCVDYL